LGGQSSELEGSKQVATLGDDYPRRGLPHSTCKIEHRMSTFFEFLSAAADFALRLSLKAAILAAGFIFMQMLTRRRDAN
jgi:hypothetical protein